MFLWCSAQALYVGSSGNYNIVLQSNLVAAATSVGAHGNSMMLVQLWLLSCRQEEVLVKVMPLDLLYDYRGGPKLVRHNDLALVGACPICKWVCVSVTGRTIACGMLHHA